MKIVKIGDIYRVLYVAKSFLISLTDITGTIIDTGGSTTAISWSGSDPTNGFCELCNGVYYYDWNTSTGSEGRYIIISNSTSNPSPSAEAVQLTSTDLNNTPLESLYSMLNDIKSITDVLPDGGALTSIAQASVVGAKTDDESGDSLYSKSYIIERHNHSQQKIYPTLATGVTITKVSTSAWGLDASTTEIIPASTVTNPFDIHFVSIGSISNNDEYELILYRGAVSSEVEIARISFNRAATLNEAAFPVITPLVAANVRISAKLTSLATSSRNIKLKLYYHEY